MDSCRWLNQYRPYISDKTFLNSKLLDCCSWGGWVDMRLGREGVARWIPLRRKQSQLFHIAGEQFKTRSQLSKLYPHPTLSGASGQTCSQVHWVWFWMNPKEEEPAITRTRKQHGKITWKTGKVIMGRSRTIIKGAMPRFSRFLSWYVMCYIYSWLYRIILGNLFFFFLT